MHSQIWVVSTLLISIVLIVLTIVKFKFHPFLALLLASFFVGTMMGMGPLDMVNAIESGIGGTLGFLAAVIGLGTILGKMMEVSGAAERIGLTLQRCRWLSVDVIMVLVGLICGITLFVEVGVVLLIPLAFSIAKKTNTSLLKLAIPLCTALMAVHCVVPPHPAALYVANKLGADIGSVIVYGLLVGLMASLIGGPLFLKFLGQRLPFKPVPTEFADLKVRDEKTLPSLGATLFTILLPIPLVKDLVALKETTWFNPGTTSLAEGLPYVGLTEQDVQDAHARLSRFAPYLAKAFPETAATGGIIESELVAIPAMQKRLEKEYQQPISGQLLLKKDSHLPISGSIKARGGIYEVLAHAEKLALEAGLLTLDDDYSKLLSPEFKQFFSQYSIAVGSTGNLGLSIGIMSARIGFKVTVHMSADARAWKKAKLRSHGVTVVEYEQDYGVAVEEGRKAAQSDPNCFFIDDENSRTLFLGYSVAGQRLKAQFAQQGRIVDADNPLFVYLPCGVGGGPGGVAFGLKLAFGDHVHCFFAEPTHSPCMLLGVHTGLHDQISVQDIGIDNLTAADGLAVGRASGFVGRAMERLLDGFYTLSDQTMYDMLGWLAQEEGIRLEPSALAGMAGPQRVCASVSYQQMHGFSAEQLRNATHLVWATGGGMVPEEEMNQYLAKGR
ncbi:D-serine ammonia-lyase [Escherichia coli]|nr:D-serine ammonia-lyase [Escherichia coli]